ncbi:MAG: PEP-CTERM sorting domain-containing protein [Armatimonadota bacterium]
MKILASLGFATLALSAHATLFTFNSGPIDLLDNSPASPSPVDFNVTGLDGNVTNVGIYFNGITHAFPEDLGAVLFSSTGHGTLLFDGPGNADETNTAAWDWKFDESITNVKLSDTGSNPTGFYAAGQNKFSDTFTGAPTGPYGSSLLDYNGLTSAQALGHWLLYIQDFVPPDAGTIQNVQLRITTTPVPEPATLAVLGLGIFGLMQTRKRR